MTRHKDFSGGTKVEDFEPLTFTLNGSQFTAKPAIQGTALLEFVANADAENGSAAATALYDFFKSVMEAPEYERFMVLLKSEDVIIDMELIGEIAGWLVEQYATRPTARPSSSLDGHSISGTTSTAAPSSEVSV